MTGPVLEVSGLGVSREADDGGVALLLPTSFALEGGTTLGIVGESGSGKSLTALALMDLLARNLRASGSIRLRGREIATLPPPERRALCGREIAMVFQDPMTALNPVYSVGAQIAEALRRHRPMSRRAARAEAVALLRRVGIPDPEQRVESYPHQLSGGMRQRVVIAIALAGQPAVLIADEPTTALDVTVQAQVLALFRELRDRSRMATILISHDLGVIAETADRVLVLYAGGVVEAAPVGSVFADPLHPYTIGLLGALPRLEAERGRLASIPGRVPQPGALPPGCRFADRCPFVIDACREASPPLRHLPDGRQVACIRAPLPAEAA